MNQILAKVISNQEYIPTIYNMVIEAPNAFESAYSGQFAAVRCGSGTTAILRRPLSICDATADTMRLMYQAKGKGTAMLAELKAGDMVDLIAPIGKGFRFEQDMEGAVLIGGGIGIYPLLMLAKQLKNPHVFLGFRDKSLVHMVDEFEAVGARVEVSTDDGSFGFNGRVTELATEHIIQNGCGTIFACGPKPMLKAVQELAFDFDLPCQLSMEERMGCGVGACLGCACKTRKGEDWEYKHICKDGPVFDAKEVLFDD